MVFNGWINESMNEGVDELIKVAFDTLLLAILLLCEIVLCEISQLLTDGDRS